MSRKILVPAFLVAGTAAMALLFQAPVEPTVTTVSEIPVYRKATYSVPETFDPHASISTAEHTISNLIYDGLFSINEMLEIEPVLVESWDIQDEGKTYTFKIRSDRKFSDGSPLTTQDVVTSLKRLQDPKVPASAQYKRIVSINDAGEGNVEVKLSKAFPAFVSTLAAPFAKIFKPQTGSAYPLGTGAYKFLAIESIQEIKTLRLQRNEYGFRTPAIDRLDMMLVDEDAAVKLVAAGYLHDTALLPSKSGSLTNTERGVETNAAAAQTWLVSFNNKKAPTNQLGLRRCLARSVDKDDFRNKFAPDHNVADSYIPPTLIGSGLDKRSVTKLEADCKAFAGTKLKIDFPEVMGDKEKLCQFWKDSWEPQGLTIQCRPLPFGELITNIATGDYDLSFLGMSLDLPNVEYFVNTFETSSQFNLANYSSKNIDALLEKARSEPDRRERAKAYRAIDRELYEQEVTLNLTYPRHVSFRHVCLQGFRVNMAGEQFIDYTKITLNPNCRFTDDFAYKDLNEVH